MDINNISLDEDVETILSRKIEHHAEQKDLHYFKMLEAQKALAAFKAGSRTVVMNSEVHKVDYSEFRAIDWERAVKRVLGESATAMKTVEIMDEITGGLYTPEQRRDYVKAISGTLNKMQINGEVYSERIDGEKGRIYSLVRGELQTEQGGTRTVYQPQVSKDLPF